MTRSAPTSTDAAAARASGRRPRIDPAFRPLVAADTKDLARTLQTGFASLFLFAFFLLVIGTIDFMFSVGASAPKVAIVSTDASFVDEIEAQLEERELAVTDPDAATLVIREEQGRIAIVVDAEENPDWHAAWQSVRGTGAAVRDISVLDTDGVWRADILQQNLAPAIGIGFMAIVFVGTAVPLVGSRERGLLRLLGTTPVRSSTFILSLIPARSVVAIVEIAVVLIIAVSRSYVDAGMLWRLTISLVLGLAMLFPLAFLLAARARNAANMQQLMVALTMLLVGIGGGIFPTQAIPVPIQVIFSALPTTWMIQAIGIDLAGVEPLLNVYVLWVLMATCAATALLLAARIFSWDRETRSGWRASDDA